LPINATFPLNPGSSGDIGLPLHVADCVISGTVPFSVTAYSQEGQQVATVETTLTLLTDPLQTEVVPADGSRMGARTVLFSWHTDAPTTGRLTLYPSLLPD
jgi:hypothetical protein